jgi:hypothetical protein
VPFVDEDFFMEAQTEGVGGGVESGLANSSMEDIIVLILYEAGRISLYRRFASPIPSFLVRPFPSWKIIEDDLSHTRSTLLAGKEGVGRGEVS